MKQGLGQIFKNISYNEPPEKLERVILYNIEQEKNRAIRKKSLLAYAGITASLSAIILAVAIYSKEILTSEFWNISSLLFSDFTIVAKNWNEFVFSALETFPIVNTILILIPVFTLLLSLNLFITLNNHNKHKFI